jgi:hypothetical protein
MTSRETCECARDAAVSADFAPKIREICAQNTPIMYEIIAIRLNYRTVVLLCQADSVWQIQVFLHARICNSMHAMQPCAILHALEAVI